MLKLRRLTGVRWVTPAAAEVWAQLAGAWPAFLASSLGGLFLSASLTVLGRFDLAQVGYFNAAYRVTSLTRALMVPLSTLLFARASHRAAQAPAAAVAFVRRHGRLLTLPFLALSVALAATLPWALPLLLGPAYAQSYWPLFLMSFTAFSQAIGILYATYFMLPCGHDRTLLLYVLLTNLGFFPIYVGVLTAGWIPGSIALSLYLLLGDFMVAFCCRAFFLRREREMAHQGLLAGNSNTSIPQPLG
jgi:O-antigen/teichoic acid export membrane protein